MIDSAQFDASCNSFVSVKIEMTLEDVLSKVKAKAFIFSILDAVGLNDERDLFSISYAIHKQTKQVHKMIVHFKTVNAGNKFFDKIEFEKDQFKVTNLIKNIIDKENEEEQELNEMSHFKDESIHLASSNVSTDSIYVINDMAYSYIENSSLIVETSYYDIDSILPSKTNDLNINQIEDKKENQNPQEESLETLKSDIIESTSSEIVDENYYLELNLNKQLNLDDLDTVIIYLENEAGNNLFNTESSDIVDYQLDDDGFQLNIKFENKQSTEYLLNKKMIKFKDYHFQIAKKFQPPFQQYETNSDLKRTLILCNVPNEVDLNMIKMYGENIASTKVKCIYSSKIFAYTYVLKFDDDLNLDLVKQRMRRRPMLRNQQIELILPEQTNTLLLHKQPLSEIDSLVWSTNSFKSIHKRRTFYFVQFETDLAKCDFEAKLNCMDSLLVKEDLFNYEFLNRNSQIKSTHSPCRNKKRISKSNCTNEFKLNELLLPLVLFTLVLIAYLCPTKTSIRTQILKSDSEISIQPHDESFHIKIDETNHKENKQEQPQQKQQLIYIEIDINDDQNFKYLIYWPEKQVELKDELLELDAILSIDERVKKVMIWPTDKHSTQVQSGEWYLKVNAYLKDLEETFETQIIKIKNPISTLDRITYNRLRVNFNKLDEELWNSSFEICGYKEDVLALVSKIEEENKKNF